MSTPTLSPRPPALNQPVTELETPVLTVDLDAMERNIRRMATLGAEHGVAVRSHAKTQKIADIARLQNRLTDGGGILCQTLGEAEVMARHGIEDIHLVRMVVDQRKLDRLVWLADRVERFTTTVDGTEHIDRLAETASREGAQMNVVLEVDCGLERTGTTPENAPALVRRIRETPALHFDGILGHDGFVKGDARSPAEYESRWAEVGDVLERAVSAITDEGFDVPEVKTGSSATAEYAAAHPLVTEINPGRYAFWDALHLECVPRLRKDDCAVSVMTTAISKPADGRVIVDAGSKCISTMMDPEPVPKGRSDLRFSRSSSEHGIVTVADSGRRIELGDTLEFIVPSVIHAINLHDTLVGVRDGRVAEVWDVQARGKYH